MSSVGSTGMANAATAPAAIADARARPGTPTFGDVLAQALVKSAAAPGSGVTSSTLAAPGSASAPGEQPTQSATWGSGAEPGATSPPPLAPRLAAGRSLTAPGSAAARSSVAPGFAAGRSLAAPGSAPAPVLVAPGSAPAPRFQRTSAPSTVAQNTKSAKRSGDAAIGLPAPALPADRPAAPGRPAAAQSAIASARLEGVPGADAATLDAPQTVALATPQPPDRPGPPATPPPGPRAAPPLSHPLASTGHPFLSPLTRAAEPLHATASAAPAALPRFAQPLLDQAHLEPSLQLQIQGPSANFAVDTGAAGTLLAQLKLTGTVADIRLTGEAAGLLAHHTAELGLGLAGAGLTPGRLEVVAAPADSASAEFGANPESSGGHQSGTDSGADPEAPPLPEADVHSPRRSLRLKI